GGRLRRGDPRAPGRPPRLLRGAGAAGPAGGEGLHPAPRAGAALRLRAAPPAPRRPARRSALSRLVRVFFGGSRGDAVSALLDDEGWSAEELAALTKRIERMRKERGGWGSRRTSRP